MNHPEYVLHYRTMPSVRRATRRTMENHLDAEEVAWRPFLDRLSTDHGSLQVQMMRRTLTSAGLAAVFGLLRDKLGDPADFSRVTFDSFRRTVVPPPPSESVEGRLILGLHADERHDDAVAAYVRYAALELGADARAQGAAIDQAALLQRGETLLTAGHAAAALPASGVEASGLRASRARSQQLLGSLDGQIGEAAGINAEHSARLSEMRGEMAARAARLRGVVLRGERSRSRRHLQWRSRIESDLARRFEHAEVRLQALDRLGRSQQSEREKAFEALKSLFHAQLRLRAPVALWEQRSLTHHRRAVAAQRLFWAATVFAAIIGIGVPYLFGDYIADSFQTLHCSTRVATGCVRRFSAKGPLTVGGLLLTSSLILWATRLQYRIFLSERHLSLDADERKAFAETYMALKEGASVDTANETIVLASLFRPTQDGIVKDEPGGFDLSAAAMLAKQMAR